MSVQLYILFISQARLILDGVGNCADDALDDLFRISFDLKQHGLTPTDSRWKSARLIDQWESCEDCKCPGH